MLISLQDTKNIQFDINKYIKQLKEKYYSRLYAKHNIFLDGNSTHTNIYDKVDIVLSPKFYWIRKAKLPVKSASRALKIAPSFFSDVLPDGDYKYKVVKKDDDFLLFAYQEDVILKAISDSNIDISLVNKVFFAQTELDKFEAIDIQNDEILYKKDDVLIQVPASIFEQDFQSANMDYVIRHIKKTTSYISLDTYNKIIESSTSQKIIVALSFIMVFYFIEYFFIKQDLSRLAQKRDQAIKQYKIPSSTIVLNSIITSLEKKRINSILSRKELNTILSIPFKEEDYLKRVVLKTKKRNKEFFIQILLSDKDNATYYKDYLVDKMQIKTAKVDDMLLSIKAVK